MSYYNTLHTMPEFGRIDRIH